MIDSTTPISCGQSTYFCYVFIHKLLRHHVHNYVYTIVWRGDYLFSNLVYIYASDKVLIFVSIVVIYLNDVEEIDLSGIVLFSLVLGLRFYQIQIRLAFIVCICWLIGSSLCAYLWQMILIGLQICDFLVWDCHLLLSISHEGFKNTNCCYMGCHIFCLRERACKICLLYSIRTFLLFKPTFYIFLTNVFHLYFTGGSSGYCHGMRLASSELTCYVFTKFDCELVLWQLQQHELVYQSWFHLCWMQCLHIKIS